MGFTLARYVGLSVLAASSVVYHAFATRQHFYRAAIYLSSSKIAVAAMGNLAFALALCTHQLVIKMFLGSLRDIEQEMIRERLSSAVMESLLALTIFREEFSTFFVAMFASLVFIKVMHWLVQDRVDYVEVTPTISLLGHLRIVSFMVLLLALDAAFLQYTIAGTIQSSGQSVMLLFAFEYVILASTIVRYALKYGMSMVDLAMDGNWAGKGTAVFYLELIADLLHLFVYATFFTIVFMHYGLPLHLVRDLYSTFRNFRSRMHDFLRFRQVTARLDRFPDASADDLRRCDGVCIICREEMTEAGSNKRLFCGHVFHLHCLRSWLERQQNCPTCRASVFRRPAAGQQQPQAPGAAPGGEPAVPAAEGADVPHRHPRADDAADAAVVRPPLEPHAAAAAAAGSLRHRRVAGANAPANAGGAGGSRAESEASASVAASRSSSQPMPAANAAATAADAASRATPSSLPAAAASGSAPSGSGAGPSAAATGAAASAPAAGGGAGTGVSGGGSAEATLQHALQALRGEHQRLVQRLDAKRQQMQQRGAHVPKAMLTDPWFIAALAEVQQIRARIQQLELALADFLRADAEAGPGAAAAAAPSAAAAGPYPFIPGLPPFNAAAAASSSSSNAFQQLPPFFGAQPAMMAVPPMMMMPFVPVSTGANSAAAPAAAAGPAVAALQVPLHHHQLAAAAAAAAASAAAAAMFGAGVFPNGGGMFFVPHPLQPQQPAQQAAAAADPSGAGASAASGAGEGAGNAEPASAATVPAAAAAVTSSSSEETAPAVAAAVAPPKDPATSASGSDVVLAPEAGSTGAEVEPGAAEDAPSAASAAAATAEPVAPAPAAGEEAAPAAVALAGADGEATEAGGAGAEEDPQEAIRRIRLQRFGQQS